MNRLDEIERQLKLVADFAESTAKLINNLTDITNLQAQQIERLEQDIKALNIKEGLSVL